ncbi:hypothetical protein BRC76_04175 [Halobacteriales archaeon QH_8_67_36]|nr:MAG: hypothetical protein BRC76_04175 [Halobacteriales archaeon QH_8_67_36]
MRRPGRRGRRVVAIGLVVVLTRHQVAERLARRAIKVAAEELPGAVVAVSDEVGGLFREVCGPRPASSAVPSRSVPRSDGVSDSPVSSVVAVTFASLFSSSCARVAPDVAAAVSVIISTFDPA